MTADPEHLHIGPVEIRLERVVYATVVLMSVLAVYDGWAELTSFLGVAVVIVALSLVAGRRAGIRGWRLAVAALSGGLVGLLVISLQVLLKPH